MAPPSLATAKLESSDPKSYTFLPEEASERKREAICTANYNAAAIYGAGRNDTQTGLIANFGSNPGEAFVWTIWAQNAIDTETWGTDITAFVEIVYKVDCLEPKQQTGD